MTIVDFKPVVEANPKNTTPSEETGRFIYLVGICLSWIIYIYYIIYAKGKHLVAGKYVLLSPS